MGVIKDISSNRYDSLIHPRLRNQSTVVNIISLIIRSSVPNLITVSSINPQMISNYIPVSQY
jgi:hypothetical protein